ncbi:MAG: hypothetical protein AB3N11_12075 [Arenibacterium sp.]
MTLFRSLLFAFGFMAALPAQAQDIIGTTVIDGQRIEILSGFTWRYADQDTATGCINYQHGVSFCGLGDGWDITRSNNADAVASFTWYDRVFGMIVAEGLGATDGLVLDSLREIVLGFIAEEQGINTSDVPVLSEEAVEIDGRPAKTLVYKGVINGLNLIYFNSIMSLPHRTFQFVTFTVGTDVTDDQKAAHAALIGNIRIGE